MIKRSFYANYDLENTEIYTDIYSKLPKITSNKNIHPLPGVIRDTIDVTNLYRRVSANEYSLDNSFSKAVAFLTERKNLLLYAPFFLASGAKVFTLVQDWETATVVDIDENLDYFFISHFGLTSSCTNLLSVTLSMLMHSKIITYTPHDKMSLINNLKTLREYNSPNSFHKYLYEISYKFAKEYYKEYSEGDGETSMMRAIHSIMNNTFTQRVSSVVRKRNLVGLDKPTDLVPFLRRAMKNIGNYYPTNKAASDYTYIMLAIYTTLFGGGVEV